MGSPKLYLLSVLLVFTSSVRGSGFDYHYQPKWLDDYPECGLYRQSPIEFITTETETDYNMAGISYLNYEKIFTSVTIQNNGHTANIAIPKSADDADAPRIIGGPLGNDEFIADSIHFHWGSRSTHGSEHVIDSKRHSVEMHIVHRNKVYPSVEIARDHEDGLAVLSVLFDAETNRADYDGLTKVVASLPAISGYDMESEIENFSLLELIQNLNKEEFFTYQGSLTTPPCSQAVTWIVMANAVPITQSQFENFHQLFDSHGDVLENNYRALQPKGERKVTFRRSVNRLWDIVPLVRY